MNMIATIIAFSTLILFAKCGLPIQSDFDELSSLLECGYVVTPNNNTFNHYTKNNFSTWDNLKIPSAIIMCSCENDVAIAMKWVSQFLDSTTFRIRSGGNSFGGYSKLSDAIVIDLSHMKNINILNSDKQQITVEPGINLYDFEEWRASNIYFTATLPHGLCPYVSFGGYATGGGIGLQSKQWGATTDYIYGINIVLCDGSLWQIFENNYRDTKCITQCDHTILTKRNAQNLLYAIKGSGGGNYGIITRYYFNTVKAPENPLFFHLVFSLKTRADIFNAHNAFQNIFKNDFASIQKDFSIALIISPKPDNENNDFPYFFAINFYCIYLPSKTSNQNSNVLKFYEIINKLVEYMESSYILTDSIITTDMSITDIYRFNIFPQITPPIDGNSLHGYPSTRLIYENDYNEQSINVLTEYIYQNVIVNSLLLTTGIVNSFFIESLGGKLSIRNRDTSFPIQNRNAWAVYEIFNIIPMPLSPEIPFEALPGLTELTKTLRNNVDENVLSTFGEDKYVNYLDDIDTDLTHYYSQTEINRLSKIKQKIDPNSCFRFELGINNNNNVGIDITNN